jgi:hypothetical protein
MRGTGASQQPDRPDLRRRTSKTPSRALVGYPVFHNHLVVDALTTVFPFGSEPFVRLREQFWLQVFADAARAGRSLTFTFAPEATVPPGFPARARAAVESSGGKVRFVRLLVTDSEQERRVVNADRRQFHKLSDLMVQEAAPRYPEPN